MSANLLYKVKTSHLPVKVDLIDTNGNLLQTANHAAVGEYQFSNVADGQVKLRATDAQGFVLLSGTYTISCPAHVCSINVTIDDINEDPADPEVSVQCGSYVNYNYGTMAFPHTSEVILGTGTGLVKLYFDPISIPDRLIVYMGGVVVLDTGYVGAPSYLEQLNNRLTEIGAETVTSITDIQFAGATDYSFDKTSSAVTKVLVEVYGPLGGTEWSYRINCPGVV